MVIYLLYYLIKMENHTHSFKNLFLLFVPNSTDLEIKITVC